MAQDVYKDILMEHNISPTRIHNVDVSNSFIVQKTKDICTNWKKTGPGREQVAAVCRVNPYGKYIPAAFIFPSKYWKNEHIDSATVGAFGTAHEPG